MANFEIDDIMVEILECFHKEGNLTTGALVNQTGRARNTINKRLDRLRVGEYLEYVDKPTALHRLVEDPRDGHEVPLNEDQQSLHGFATPAEESSDDSGGRMDG